MLEKFREQFKPVPIEPCADFKWVDTTNHVLQTKAATNTPRPACKDSGIVDGEFDGALECACKKGTNQ